MRPAFLIADADGNLVDAADSRSQADDMAGALSMRTGLPVDFLSTDTGVRKNDGEPENILVGADRMPLRALQASTLPVLQWRDIEAVLNDRTACRAAIEVIRAAARRPSAKALVEKDMLRDNTKLEKTREGTFAQSIGLMLSPYWMSGLFMQGVIPNGPKIGTVNTEEGREFVKTVIGVAATSASPPKGLGQLPNLCVGSSPQCRSACIVLAGNNNMPAAVAIKLRMTEALLRHPLEFMVTLAQAVRIYAAKATAVGDAPFVRYNVFSDVPWELVVVDKNGPGAFFRNMRRMTGAGAYDYTKVYNRKVNRKDYDLTFSYSGKNMLLVEKTLKAGNRVAVVFAARKAGGKIVQGGLPKTFLGVDVKPGTEDDLRALDPPKLVIGLAWMGRKITDYEKLIGGFVYPVELDPVSGFYIAAPLQSSTGGTGRNVAQETVEDD